MNIFNFSRHLALASLLVFTGGSAALADGSGCVYEPGGPSTPAPGPATPACDSSRRVQTLVGGTVNIHSVDTPAASVPVTAAGTFPVTTTNQSKSSSILSTTPLAASAVFTGPWNDTNLTNQVFVASSAYSNLTLGYGSWVIQETDDTTNTQTQNTAVTGGINANVNNLISGTITQRYWRVVVTNSTTAMTTFELTASASPAFGNVGLFNPGNGKVVDVNTSQNDGQGNYGQGLQTISSNQAFDGQDLDRVRINRSSNAVGGVSVANGGVFRNILTSTSATVCTSLATKFNSNSKGKLFRIINAGAAQTVTINVYDENTTPTCAAADLLFSRVLSVNENDPLEIPLLNGLAYSLSGALTANVVITSD